VDKVYFTAVIVKCHQINEFVGSMEVRTGRLHYA